MRKLLSAGVVVTALGMLLTASSCGSKHGDDGVGGDGGSGSNHGQDACAGLECQVTDCAAASKPPTTLSGRVFAPNGTLPLYDVKVYVPNTDPGPLASGLSCSQCADQLPGDPIAQTTTDDHGNFTLTGVPDGSNIPLVVTIGKWRRQLVLPTVGQCTTTAVDAVDTTLPKSRTDMTPNTKSVDLPNIAISTGGADALECLVRKLGIDDSEIKTDGQDGRIHLFTDASSGGQGASQFKNGYAGGSGNFADSQTLWGTSSDPGKLANYDIVILSCEGGQHDETKSQDSMNHLKAYADAGGRVFLSHWHNIWIEGNTQNGGNHKPAVWPTIAAFNDSSTTLDDNTNDLIDEVDNPKGSAFATWMLDPQVMGSTTQDQVPIENGTGKNTCDSVDPGKGEDWINWEHGGSDKPQMFQFTTPNEVASDQRCGKVVFSDMHVSGDSSSKPGSGNRAFPNGCANSDLTPQEKALAFMFFDISSCVGSIGIVKP